MESHEPPYAAFLESCPDPAIIVRLPSAGETLAAARVLAANRRALELLGYSAEEFLGLHPVRYIHPSSLRRVDWRGQLQDREFVAGALVRQLVREDGSVVDVSTTVYPVALEDGATGILTINHELGTQAASSVGPILSKYTSVNAIAQVGTWEWDRASDFVLVSPEGYRLLGILSNSYAAWTSEFFRRIHEEYRERIECATREAISKRLPLIAMSYAYDAPGGSRLIRNRSSVTYAADGHVERVFGVVQDVTEQLRDEESRREVEERYQALVELLPDAVALTVDSQIRYVNAAGAQLLGYDSPDKLTGAHLRGFIHPAYRDAAIFSPVLGTAAPRALKLVRADGELVDVELSSAPIGSSGEDARLVVLRDIAHRSETERGQTQANERAERLALYDELTDLPNRTLLLDRVQQSVESAHRTGRSLAVLFMDLDGFKEINDSLGHAAGDALLRAVAARLQGAVRTTDTVARLGGDEFVVLLTSLQTSEQVLQIAHSLQRRLKQPFQIDQHRLFAPASVGIAIGPTDASDADTLIRYADIAMYQAKRQGVGSVQFFTPRLHEAIARKLRLTTDLRGAIGSGQMSPRFQPIATCGGELVGFEALLRWTHPSEGGIPPSEFIPVAESAGLIQELGTWVLEEALRCVGKWRQSGIDLLASVNVSGWQLRDSSFAQFVEELLTKHGVPASSLALEVTESTIVDDVEHALANLKLLRDLGVQVSVDDFGAGYSMLRYLRRFPITSVKIDHTFVRDMLHDNTTRAMVDGLIALAHSLDLTVIAEGVETLPQLEYLRTRGIDLYQGYFLSPPLEALEFESRVAERAA